MKAKLRSMIAAPKGKVLVSVDLSQAETWIVAYLANEERMKKALHFGDIHTETAGSAIFFKDVPCVHEWKKVGKEFTCGNCNKTVTDIMRYTGKRCNHAYSYDMGPERNAQVINKESDQPPFLIVSIAQTKVYYANWHSYYYRIKEWHNSTVLQLSNSRTLITPYHRERTFYGAWGKELFKEAYANIPQSTVADHFNGKVQRELGIRGGLLEVYKQLGTAIEIINQSHDSLIAIADASSYIDTTHHIVNLIRRPLVVNGEQFTIPVDAEVGTRWGELERLKVA